jgi:hypothetical protein
LGLYTVDSAPQKLTMDINNVVKLDKSAGHVIEELQPGIEQTQNMNATEGKTGVGFNRESEAMTDAL